MTVQVPSIKFAEPKPLIGAAFHFSIPGAGAPQTRALAHFSFVFSIREEKAGDGRQERRAGKQPKAEGGGEPGAGRGAGEGSPAPTRRAATATPLTAHLAWPLMPLSSLDEAGGELGPAPRGEVPPPHPRGSAGPAGRGQPRDGWARVCWVGRVPAALRSALRGGQLRLAGPLPGQGVLSLRLRLRAPASAFQISAGEPELWHSQAAFLHRLLNQVGGEEGGAELLLLGLQRALGADQVTGWGGSPPSRLLQGSWGS